MQPPWPCTINAQAYLRLGDHKQKSDSSSFYFPFSCNLSSLYTMSDICGNCDCADKSSCVKKGSSYGAVIMEAEKSHFDAIDMDFPAAEHNDKCNCNPCNCKNCQCGN